MFDELVEISNILDFSNILDLISTTEVLHIQKEIKRFISTFLLKPSSKFHPCYVESCILIASQ